MIRARSALYLWLAAAACLQAGAQVMSFHVTGVKVSPDEASVGVGETLELSAEAVGTGTFDKSVKWMEVPPAGWTGSVGAIHPQSNGKAFYETPYPAPPGVTLIASSVADSSVSAKVKVTLVVPKTAAGPALTIDGSKSHPINPLIYGMNDFAQDASLASMVDLPVNRWGGDAATPYNYKLDVTTAGADWFFEANPNKNKRFPDESEVNSLVERNLKTHTVSIVTMPLIGWTTLRKKACAFPVDKFGPQEKVNPYDGRCGNGMKPDGKTQITGNDPHDTSMEIDENWTSGWVTDLSKRYSDAVHGGVQIYELDNEPEYWASTHRDLHPAELTYDEVTLKGISYAKAIKEADATAQVMGPVISDWTGYFYSHQDMMNGWHTGPCYCANGAPADRLAHGDVPLIPYYLRAMKKQQDENGKRLLDYLDLHTYFAATDAGLHPAGDTMLQKARLNSTRAFWDPTYLDGDTKDPDDRTKAARVISPQIIPRMKRWVAEEYPGTRTAITEYSYGGLEHINGAIAQADVLGIFGRESLDLATLWGPPDPKKEFPGLAAFLIYRNYDGAGAKFGDTAIAATSGDQSKLAIYAARRTSDGAVTIIVLNKTYGELKTSVTLGGVVTGKTAKVYSYSVDNLKAIAAVPDVRVNFAGKLNATFPPESITLFVLGSR